MMVLPMLDAFDVPRSRTKRCERTRRGLRRTRCGSGSSGPARCSTRAATSTANCRHGAGERTLELAMRNLASSTVAHGVVATPDGIILGTTAAMDRLLGNEPEHFNGRSLWEFLTPRSASELRSRVEAGIRCPELRLPVTFVGGASGAHVLLCNLDVQPHAFALLGEPASALEERCVTTPGGHRNE